MIRTISFPAAFPVSLDDAKTHLGIVGDDNDAYVAQLIRATTAHVEQYLDRALVTRTSQFFLERFPAADYIELPLGCLQSVLSVKYTDVTGTVNTLNPGNYTTEINDTRSRIRLGYQLSWPTATLLPGLAIQIEFISGYKKGLAYQAASTYVVGDLIEPTSPNGLVYECTDALTPDTETEPVWPLAIGDTVQDGAGATEGTWTCSGMSVPTPIVQAILLLIGNLFENRETIIVGTPSSELKTLHVLLLPYVLFDWTH